MVGLILLQQTEDTRHYALGTKESIVRGVSGIEHRAWSIEQGDTSQNPEVRRKAIKIKFI